MTNPNANNSENFTLHDFMEITGETLLERVTPFAETIDDYNRKGRTLYSREIVGPPGPRVQMRDPLTGAVREMIMMGSNDYLGFSNHPEIRAKTIESIMRNGIGMGGPPLLNGMSETHRRLERALADLKSQEDSLLFSSGFMTNLGWTYALFRPGDVVLYDELNHASFYDGLLLTKSSRKVKAFRFRHNDTADLEQHLQRAAETKSPDRSSSSSSKAFTRWMAMSPRCRRSATSAKNIARPSSWMTRTEPESSDRRVGELRTTTV